MNLEEHPNLDIRKNDKIHIVLIKPGGEQYFVPTCVYNDINAIKNYRLGADIDMLFVSDPFEHGFLYEKNGQEIAKVCFKADVSGGKKDNKFNKAKLSIYDVRDKNKPVLFNQINGIAGEDLFDNSETKHPTLKARYTDWVINNIKLMEKIQDESLPEKWKNDEGEEEQLLFKNIDLDGHQVFLTFNEEERQIKRYVVYPKTGYIVEPPKDITKLVNTLALPFSTGNFGAGDLDYKDGIRHISIEYDEGKQEPGWYTAGDKNKPLEPYWASLDEYMQRYKKFKIPHNLLKDLQPGQTFRISNNFCIYPMDNTIDGQHYDYGLGHIQEGFYRNAGYINGEDVILNHVDTKTLEQDGAMIEEGEKGECILQGKIIHLPHEWKKIKQEFRKDYFGNLISYAELDTGIKVKDRNNGKIYKLCYVDHESSDGCFKFKDETGNFATIKDKNNNSNTLGNDNNNLMRIIANKDEAWTNNRYYFYCLRPYEGWNGDSDYAFGMSVPLEDQRPYDNKDFFNGLLIDFLQSQFHQYFEVYEDEEQEKEPEKKLDEPENEPDDKKEENVEDEQDNDQEKENDDQDNDNQNNNNQENDKNKNDNEGDDQKNQQKPFWNAGEVTLENGIINHENDNTENDTKGIIEEQKSPRIEPLEQRRFGQQFGFGNRVGTRDGIGLQNKISNMRQPTVKKQNINTLKSVGQIFDSSERKTANNFKNTDHQIKTFFPLRGTDNAKQNVPTINTIGFKNSLMNSNQINNGGKSTSPNQNGNNQNNQQNSPSSVNSNNKQQNQQKSSYVITFIAGTGALAGSIIAIVMRDKKVAVIVGSATAVVSALTALISGISTYNDNSKVEENRKMNNSVNNNLGSGEQGKQI